MAGAMAGGPKTIQVYLRVRPTTELERAADHTCDRIAFPDGTTSCVRLKLPVATAAPTTYPFTRVFPPEATQEELYAHFGAGAVTAALNGEHGVLMAYGQTGSGKTYSIASSTGVVPRALRQLWQHIDADTERTFEVAASIVEIYNNELFDLSDPASPALKFHRRHAALRPVQTLSAALELFQQGFARRETSATAMNDRSSRSHLVLTVCVLQRPAPGNSGPILDGRLMVCDLAGSERLVKTQATGLQRDEGISINLSLLSLGNAVAALSRGQPFTRFRDSLLTRLLQPALEGHGDTSILIAASPSDSNIQETWHAIEFGQRASGLKQNSERHEILNYKNLYQDALGDIAGLQQQLRDRDALIVRLEAHIRALAVATPGGAARPGSNMIGVGPEPFGSNSNERSSSSSSSFDSSRSTSPRATTTSIEGADTRRTVTTDDGGEAVNHSPGRRGRPAHRAMSPRFLMAHVGELREELELRDEVIAAQEADIETLDKLLQGERNLRLSMRQKYDDTLSDVVKLQAMLRDLHQRSQSASPHASPVRPIAQVGSAVDAKSDAACCTLM